MTESGRLNGQVLPQVKCCIGYLRKQFLHKLTPAAKATSALRRRLVRHDQDTDNLTSPTHRRSLEAIQAQVQAQGRS